MSLKNKLPIILATLLLLVITGFFYSQKALSFRFVDEEDNFVFGKYLTRGEKIYDDLISNHQPMTYILSYAVQKSSSPNSVFQLVSNHRYALIAWAIFWSILLAYYFGFGVLIFSLIFELTKIYLLGNLFLAESLIVYPLLFIVGSILFLKEKLDTFKLILWGICLGLSAFLLSPIWPLLATSLVLVLIKQKGQAFKSLGLISAGVAVPVVLTFIFSDFIGYFYYNIWANLSYTVPAYRHEPWISTIVKSFFSPLISFLPAPINPTLWAIRIFSLLLIINLLWKRNIKIGVIIFILLGLTNLRFINPGDEGYAGFHILPWYGLLIFISSLISVSNLETIKRKRIFILNVTALTVISVLSLNFAKTGLFYKSDVMKDYYINYSTYISIGDTIKSIKQADNTLFVSPNSWLIYWQADINHLPKLYGYYAWMSGLPKLHQAILNSFETNPPTFFYCDDCQGIDLKKYLSKYKEFKKEGSSTRLYVLSPK